MMLAGRDNKLRSGFTGRFSSKALAYALENVELVEIAIDPGNIVSVPHRRLKIAIRRSLAVEINAVEHNVLVCIRNRHESAPERRAGAGLGIPAVQAPELDTFDPGIREHVLIVAIVVAEIQDNDRSAIR